MSLGSVGQIAVAAGSLEDGLGLFREAHEIFAAAGIKPYVQRSARDVVRTCFRLAAQAVHVSDWLNAERMFLDGLSYARDAGAENVLNDFAAHLVIPVLRKDISSAEAIRPFATRLRRYEVLHDHETSLVPVEALLEYYASNRSREPLDRLGPTENMVFQAMVEHVERPLHVEAREALKAGKAAEAVTLYERILTESPEDVEARLNLATALSMLGRHGEAETQVENLLERRAGFPSALLVLAQIQDATGRADRAIETLQGAIEESPEESDLYGPLARLLRRERRHGDLAEILERWGRVSEDEDLRRKIAIWTAEAYLLSSQPGRVADALTRADFTLDDPGLQVELGVLRVFEALYSDDLSKARNAASALLTLASEIPRDKATEILRPDVLEAARDCLPERFFRFFFALEMTLSHRSDPLRFAEEFLGDEDKEGLRKTRDEEGRSAIEAMHSGHVNQFSDLHVLSQRSAGPSAAIEALGDAFGEFREGEQHALVRVFIEALKEGRPVEVSAALGALGQNVGELKPEERNEYFSTLLGIAGKPETDFVVRETVQRSINILYPNLDPPERRRFFEALSGSPEDRRTPALREFFEEVATGEESREQSEERP